MNRQIIVLGIILGGFFMANSVFASTITDNIVPSKYISVISQDFVDEHLEYKFTMIDETHWRAEFKVDNVSLAADIQSARNKQCTNIAWLNIKNTYFADDVLHTSIETCSAIKNMTNYPLHAGNDVSYSNFAWNQATANGSFDITFPNGFISGTILDLGFGSTVASAITTTIVLSTTGRAICRTTNKIHVVFMAQTLAVHAFYTNSSDGITWGTPISVDSAVAVAEPPVIDCSGTNVIVAWMSAASRKDIYYTNSTNENIVEGGEKIWRDGTGASAAAIHMGNVMFGRGSGINQNVWMTYQWDGGTSETMIVDNSTSYGGTSPTVTSQNLGVDCDVGADSMPSLHVNVSGTTEYIYVPYTCEKAVSKIFNYTNNSGTNWYGSEYFDGASYGRYINMNLMKNNIYISTMSGAPFFNKYINSTNRQTLNDWITDSLGSGWSGSIASDLTSNIYIFYTSVCTQAPSNNCDVGLTIWNTTNYTTNSYIDLNSNNATLPNTKWNASGPAGQSLIEYVYFNKTMIMYDFINLTSSEAPPPPPATCNYAGTGNWNIDCASNCDNTTQSLVVDGNLTIYSTGVGSVKFGNITAKKIDFNATHACAYYWHGRYIV